MLQSSRYCSCLQRMNNRATHHCFESHSTMTLRCALLVAIVLAALISSVGSAAKSRAKQVQLESLEEVLERMMREIENRPEPEKKKEPEELPRMRSLLPETSDEVEEEDEEDEDEENEEEEVEEKKEKEKKEEEKKEDEKKEEKPKQETSPAPKESPITGTTGTSRQEATTNHYTESPQLVSHNIYTKPGSPDKTCRCVEMTDEEWTSSGGSSGHHGSSASRDREEYCFPNMKNIAVYEGKVDTPMNVKASHCNVAWTVVPTTDEFESYAITSSGCKGDPRVAKLYNVNPSGLDIRKSTTSEDGQAISTAGLYIAECISSGEKAGAKLLVVSSGPTCSCVIDSSSSSVRLNCSVDFADGTTHPISAIFSWTVNGEQYAEADTPIQDRKDVYVFTATSSIEISGSVVNDYKCTLTFGEPLTGDQYEFIATNAPEFSESCSTPCEKQ